MPRRYSNPPLIEALAEFVFTSTAPWDWTVPGLIYRRIEHEFPTKREQGLVQLQVQAPGMDAPQEIRQGIGKMQFLTPDEAGIVQVGPNLLAVNRLRPYPGWSQFRQTVIDQLRHYLEVARPSGLGRISLRYINRIVVPSDHLDLTDFFHALPGLPTDLAGTVLSFRSSVDIGYEAPGSRLRLTVGSASDGDPNESPFLMDFEVVSLEPVALDVNEISAWLDASHDRIERTFDSSVTERSHRDLFGALET